MVAGPRCATSFLHRNLAIVGVVDDQRRQGDAQQLPGAVEFADAVAGQSLNLRLDNRL